MLQLVSTVLEPMNQLYSLTKMNVSSNLRASFFNDTNSSGGEIVIELIVLRGVFGDQVQADAIFLWFQRTIDDAVIERRNVRVSKISYALTVPHNYIAYS